MTRGPSFGQWRKRLGVIGPTLTALITLNHSCSEDDDDDDADVLGEFIWVEENGIDDSGLLARKHAFLPIGRLSNGYFGPLQEPKSKQAEDRPVLFVPFQDTDRPIIAAPTLASFLGLVAYWPGFPSPTITLGEWRSGRTKLLKEEPSVARMTEALAKLPGVSIPDNPTLIYQSLADDPELEDIRTKAAERIEKALSRPTVETITKHIENHLKTTKWDLYIYVDEVVIEPAKIVVRVGINAPKPRRALELPVLLKNVLTKIRTGIPSGKRVVKVQAFYEPLTRQEVGSSERAFLNRLLNVATKSRATELAALLEERLEIA